MYGKRYLSAILIAILLGALVGGQYPDGGIAVKFLGDLFLNALKMMVVPLVVASMVVGITNLGDIRKLGAIGRRTIIYYMVTTGMSVVVGLILVNLIGPGKGVELPGFEVAESIREKEFSFIHVVVGLVPDNLFKAMAQTDVLPLIVFSLVFGGILTTMGEKGRSLIELFSTVNEVIMKTVTLIMKFAPVGIFALIAARLGQAGGWEGFGPELVKLSKYSLTVILGLLFHGLIALPLILKFFGRLRVFGYSSNMLPALTTAFSTASSSATLPLTIECVEEGNQIPNRVASFVLPLGATINMDGTALYEAVAAVFIAQLYGFELSFVHLVIIFLTATLAAIGAAGIPEAGLVTMVIVLRAVDLPIEGIALILSVDWFLDRCRTTVNVWGDSVGAAVIARYEEGGVEA